MPVTELPKTLVNLLGTLLTENGLLSWQIFEEKSSNIVVKIRFGNGHCDLAADRQPSEAFTAYRRKAPSQVKRDHARVAAHKRQQSTAARMTTRSMATCLQTEPCATDQDVPADEIEQTRYGDNCLDPQAITCEPLCQPSCYAHDDSLLYKENDCLSLPADMLSRPSISCIDTPPACCDPECSTVLATQPTLLSPHSDSQLTIDSDGDDTAVSLDIRSSCSSRDQVTTDPETEPCATDISTLLDALRSEIRSAVVDFQRSVNPD